MDAKTDGGPAFPVTTVTRYGDEHQCPGMSLRDWFAGQALNGIMSGPASRPMVPMSEWFDAPLQAYRLADAMLAERERVSP